MFINFIKTACQGVKINTVIITIHATNGDYEHVK